MQPQTLGTPVLFVVFIALAAYSIAGSDKRWRTFGFILLSAAIGLGMGALVGFMMGSAAADGSLGGVLLIVAGAAASIRQIIDNRRRRKGG
jgi:MYXO-CTERM domain-containing protein